MSEEESLFILAGNGPYENRGCEAIVRGTVKIIRKYFRDPSFLCLSHFLSEQRYIQQAQGENDPKIIHKPIYNYVKILSREHLNRIYFRLFNPNKKKYQIYQEMLPYLDDVRAVLSIGGDNYSLDYGVPKLYTDLDDIILKKRKPLVLWGASIGPFDTLPRYKPYIINHLQKIQGIFTRESVTKEYLRRNNIVSNVYPVADPAFLLDPKQPRNMNESITIEKEAIGLNFSPLMANYVCKGDVKLWEKMAANIVNLLLKKMERTIYLIPHVTRGPNDNDFLFMQNMLTHITKSDEVVLIKPIFNAAETKWIISKMSFFAGARTHSTLASISTYVPTLSFAYSIKAIGINRDIFDHESYCLSPNNLNPDLVIKKMESLFSSREDIRSILREKVPILEKRAMDAGKYLRHLIDECEIQCQNFR